MARFGREVGYKALGDRSPTTTLEMWPTLKILLILGGLTTLTEAFNYMFIMDDDGLMAPCEDQPGNHINFMDGLFDMSKSKLGKFDGKLRMEGDLIVKWTDVQPDDTITVSYTPKLCPNPIDPCPPLVRGTDIQVGAQRLAEDHVLGQQ